MEEPLQMSSDAIIQAQGLSKSFKTYSSKAQQLKSWLMPWRHDLYHAIPVLRDINFTIKKGESVGIVGQNGAGKSTLLKLLTGTTSPTSGHFIINGELSALLELGMGFHGDFTGRQNCYLSGSILGMHQSEIDSLLPEIEQFAEIGEYFDHPVRTYSSGMQVRLAFSIATARRPDILIIDEALAVGDTYFQHKCFSRIRSFREAGTTLLFVSHDPAAVKSLCDRALLLENGRIALDDTPQQVLNYYNALIADKEQLNITQNAAQGVLAQTRSGSGLAKIEQVSTCHPERGASNTFNVGEPCQIKIRIHQAQALTNLTAGIMIRDRVGNDIFGTNTWHLLGRGLEPEQQSAVLTFELESLNLGVGSYSITVALHDRDNHVSGNYDWWDNAAVFDIIPGPQPEFAGSTFLKTTAHFEQRD